ncbi:MAG: ABC transporter permease subunit [Planctomycetes bacterium]|nr:ABC transporter permease subunit [Planctomycetota bacterium]
MRAYELIKETFCRKLYILIVHLSWLTLYGIFWWLFLPKVNEFGRFIFIWGGCFLALALSTGIFGDDISSGRICVLVTKPFRLGELYIYRLLGLSLQAAVHFILAWCVIFILNALMRTGSTDNLGLWLFASWLLFNTCAALSTSLSVVVGRAYNALLLLVVIITVFFVVSMMMVYLKQHSETEVLVSFISYACPPFKLLYKFACGEYGKYSLTVGRFSLAKSVACVVHSLILTVVYSVVGIVLLSRRQFSCGRD